MTPEQFAYWLNGFAELCDTPPTAEQWRSIKEHIALTITKVTPGIQAKGIIPSQIKKLCEPDSSLICSADPTARTYC